MTEAQIMPTILEYEITPALTEDQVWSNDVAPALGDVAQNVFDIWQFAVTEMVNNAIDHSGGSKLTVRIHDEGEITKIVVKDNGVGIFRKIQAALNLIDERHAILELSKGKLTTDPEKHSGQGIFFTSRVMDKFAILSGSAYFSHNARRESDWIMENPDSEDGTVVIMRLHRGSSRTIKQVSDQFSSGEGADFTKTVVPVALAQYGRDKLVSRSQAKRILLRVDQFQTVIFDFTGVETIGQAFADQIFRVFARSHPHIQSFIMSANAEILQVVAAVAASEPNVHIAK